MPQSHKHKEDVDSMRHNSCLQGSGYTRPQIGTRFKFVIQCHLLSSSSKSLPTLQWMLRFPAATFSLILSGCFTDEYLTPITDLMRFTLDLLDSKNSAVHKPDQINTLIVVLLVS